MSYFKIVRPDGVSSSTSTTYSVGQDEHFIYGLVEGYSQIDVSSEGITYSSAGEAPEITINEDGSWVFPNNEQGYELSQGANEFLLTATDDQGNQNSITLIVSLPQDLNLNPPSPPLNIKATRGANSVEISWLHSDPDVSSYNIYASQTSGGGANGYVRVNAIPLSPVAYGSSEEQANLVGSVTSDLPAEEADPLIVEILSNQSDLTTSTIGSLEVPEGATRLRIKGEVYTTELITRVSFTHNRNNTPNSQPPTFQIGEFSTLPTTTPLYYVATSVKVVDGVALESEFSVEAVAAPIDINRSNLGLPTVSDEALTTELISAVYQADPDANVAAGSAIRDMFIDPMVSEISRTRFILDFTYRTTNFISLLGIDDPLNTGTSISVANSSYKQTLQDALFMTSETQLQGLINQCFDRLASNLGITRKRGTKSVGEVVFYTTTAPTFNLDVPAGTILSSGSVSFRTTRGDGIPVVNSNLYYNPFTKRYEVTVPIEATTTGSAGNLTSNKITRGAPSGLRVTNTAPTFGGLDEETNGQLSARALSYISSVDNGTRAGYSRLAAESARVESYFIVGAGDQYMIRDNGLGGKVDIWVKGEVLNEVTDVIAPTYNAIRGDRFIPLYSEGSYVFKASSATSENPLFAMIDREGSYGLYNKTSGEFFDLTGAVISEGAVITLDATILQPSYRFTDIIVGDYRTETSEKIILTRQPVREVISVATADGTEITDYTFYKNEDPLVNGYSTAAQDYIQINNREGDRLSSFSEELVFNQTYPEALNYKGVDITSVSLYDLTTLVEYASSLKSQTPDFEVYTDSQGTTYVRRTSTSTIPEGSSIGCSYDHLENTIVTYTTNLVLSTLQDTIEEEKHMGADVIVKEVLPAPVDVKAVIYLERGSNPSTVDNVVRANLATRIEAEGQGGRLYPSDVIRELDAVTGVSHVQVPLTQLTLSQGTDVLRELVSNTAPTALTEVVSSSHQVWVCDHVISHNPQPAGGDSARVFLDGEEIPILSVNQRTLTTNWNTTCATIVGEEDFYLTLDGVYTLISGVSRRVLVSLPLGKTPNDYKIEMNYRVGDGSGFVNQIELNSLSYLTSGDFSFVYEEVN
jgi:hypothetical protein